MNMEKPFSCNQCEKKYGTKHHLKRHRVSKHSTETTSFTKSCPEGSPLEFKNVDITETKPLEFKPVDITEVKPLEFKNVDITEAKPLEFKTVDTTEDKTDFPYLIATEFVFALSDRVIFKRSDKTDICLLQKGTIVLKIGGNELRELMRFEEEINTRILELQYAKDLRYLQHFGENIYVSIQNPYNCVDIRRFWNICHTEQIHPTKIGIALQVSEFWCLIKLLKELM